MGRLVTIWPDSPRRLFWLGLTAIALACVVCFLRTPWKPGVGSVEIVSGEIMVDGEPLEEATITFIPDPSKGNTCRFFPTGPVMNGEYELSTEGKRGAPRGWYKVIVVPPTPEPDQRPPPELFDRRYMNPDKTPLSIEVVESGAQKSYNLQLPPCGKRLPGR
jgi:hypothetical protein